MCNGEFAGFGVVGHFVDEEAIGFIGWDAAGGSVWLENVAGLFELHHVVSNCCWRDMEFVTDEQGVAADGFGRGDEVLDDGFEDFLFACFGHG